MSFALHLMRKDSDCIRKVKSSRKAFIIKDSFGPKFRMFLKEPPDIVFIFLAGKSTSRIQQIPSVFEASCCRIQNRALYGRIIIGPLTHPALDEFGVFAEHALTGARSVHKYFIEKARKGIGKLVGIFAGKDIIGNARYLKILKKSLRP